VVFGEICYAGPITNLSASRKMAGDVEITRHFHFRPVVVPIENRRQSFSRIYRCRPLRCDVSSANR
jgi:hypothetical protein